MVNIQANNANYEKFVNNLNASGIRTTSINSDYEADFGDYGAALSDDLKNQILNSFDNEQDYALQNKIAGLYTNRSNLNHSEFISSCQNMGLTVSCTYQKTSYIQDYKAVQNNDVDQGSIAIYTISDGMGGEIIIADANGNGALESEELFMNQILGDINTEIGQIANAEITGSSASGSSSSVGGSSFGDDLFSITALQQDNKKVSQDEFNAEVDKLVNYSNWNLQDAIRRVKQHHDVYDINYTGSIKEQTYAEKQLAQAKADEKSEEKQTKEVKKETFNKSVESYLKEGYSAKIAEQKANNELDTDQKYTGSWDEDESIA